MILVVLEEKKVKIYIYIYEVTFCTDGPFLQTIDILTISIKII